MTHRGRKPKPWPASPHAPRLTDHALVRWVERVCGIDLRGKVEADMLGEGRGELIRKIGTGSLRLMPERVTLVIRDGVVVTVRPGGGQQA